MPAMKRYLRGISEKFGHLATWLPDEKLKLGDVGVLRDNRFYLKTSLSRLNIKYTVRPGNQGGDWGHSSGSDTVVSLDAAAKVPAAGETGGTANISFGGSGAFFFQALAARTETIEDMANVGAEIIYAYRRKEYERDWVVIDRIVTAKSATILISSSSSAKVDLAAKAPLTAVEMLADASLAVHASHTEGELTTFIAATELTPMFGASQLHTSFFSDHKVEPVRSEGSKTLPGSAAPEMPLEPVTLARWLGE